MGGNEGEGLGANRVMFKNGNMKKALTGALSGLGGGRTMLNGGGGVSSGATGEGTTPGGEGRIGGTTFCGCGGEGRFCAGGLGLLPGLLLEGGGDDGGCGGGNKLIK